MERLDDKCVPTWDDTRSLMDIDNDKILKMNKGDEIKYEYFVKGYGEMEMKVNIVCEMWAFPEVAFHIFWNDNCCNLPNVLKIVSVGCSIYSDVTNTLVV